MLPPWFLSLATRLDTYYRLILVKFINVYFMKLQTVFMIYVQKTTEIDLLLSDLLVCRFLVCLINKGFSLITDRTLFI